MEFGRGGGGGGGVVADDEGGERKGGGGGGGREEVGSVLAGDERDEHQGLAGIEAGPLCA